jgi:hypothetical protein
MTSIEKLIEEIENFYRKTFPDWEFPHKKNWIEMHKQELASTLPQQEISDEEIQSESIKRSSKYQDSNLFENTWEEAIEWYKEKLQSLNN